MRLQVVLKANSTNNELIIQSLPLPIVLIFAKEDVSARPFLVLTRPLKRYLLLPSISGVTHALR